MNINYKVTLTGTIEGDLQANESYEALTAILTEELPTATLASPHIKDSSNPFSLTWHANLATQFTSQAIAEALWMSYSRLLHLHQQVDKHLRLVYKLQDEQGEFIKVCFNDPLSDKSIFLYRFEEKMQEAFGSAAA